MTHVVLSVSLLHIALTPVFFNTIKPSTMWFVGMGLMGVFVGFLNLAAWKAGESRPLVFGLCKLANGIVTLFFVAYSFVDRDAPSYLVLSVFFLLTIFSFRYAAEQSG